MSDLIRQEHKSDKQHVTEKFDQHRKDREKAEYCSKYLDSLAFPGMRARQEIIIEPYTDTFQWIFDDSGKAVRPWGNFVEWLKKGQSIYWIQGKAGSGKSTLMRYIYEDQRTEASLKTWAGAHELLIIPFFFWKAGNDSRMQKNSAGLLRSLLYQILEKFPHLILSPAQSDNDPQNFRTGVHGLPSIPPWTEKRLLMIFRELLSDLSSTHHLCLFIDGLDELDGNQNDLVELLQDKIRGPNIKICLSSRPDRSFTHAFRSPAMLRLEDLTRKDIRLYVSRKLERAWRKSPAVDDKYWVSRMIDTILRKARGVFQWVHIVVGYLIQGLQSKDGLEELWERLDELPQEIEQLYAYMLEKIDRVHRKEVASYLQIILQVYRNPSISELTLAFYERRDQLLSPQPTLPIVEIASRCTSVRERMKLICGGLLEFRDRQDLSIKSEDNEIECVNEGTSSDQEESSLSSTGQPDAFERAKIAFRLNWTTRVHLIHRTAYDFLKDNQVGKDFVESYTPSTFDVYGSYIEARLAQLVVLAQNEEFYDSPSSPKPAGSPSSKTGIASLDQRESTTSLSSRSSVASLPRSLIRERARCGFEIEIEAIMRFTYLFEEEIEEAQAALSEKIDEVVTMLDQQFLGRPSDTHWCTRWGFPQKIEVSKDRPLPENSFQIPPIVPLDFLSFATYHGLYLYVIDTIRTRLERDDPDSMSVLLHFAASNFSMTSFCLKLVTALLRRGANPNVASYIEHFSVWTQFLVHMTEHAEMKYPRAMEDQVTSAARTFIESGADVNAKVLSLHMDPFAWIINSDVGAELKRFEGAYVEAHVSVLAFLQDATAPLSVFDEIREMCIARGALWTSKSSSLVISRIDFPRPYDLSPHQSDDVDKLVFAWSSQRAGRPVSLPLESLREILLRLRDELGLKELDERWRALE